MNWHIYLLRSGNLLYKIGVTKHLRRRIRAIQTISPIPVVPILCFCCTKGFLLERAIHRRFADVRTHGEWFNLEKDDADNFGDIIAEVADAIGAEIAWEPEPTLPPALWPAGQIGCLA